MKHHQDMPLDLSASMSAPDFFFPDNQLGMVELDDADFFNDEALQSAPNPSSSTPKKPKKRVQLSKAAAEDSSPLSPRAKRMRIPGKEVNFLKILHNNCRFFQKTIFL